MVGGAECHRVQGNSRRGTHSGIGPHNDPTRESRPSAEKNALGTVLPDMTPRVLADLIENHAAALVLFARQWCDCPADVVQEGFCKLASSSAPDDPVAWLYR